MVAQRRTSNQLVVVDDASVSSTISVGLDHKELSTSSSSSSKVQFNLALNEAHDNTVMCQEECSSLWYEASEYKSFKAATFNFAKAIIQAEKNNRAPYSYQRVLERTFDVCKGAVNEAQDYQRLSTCADRLHLYRWAELAPSRLGMEKWAVRSIAQQKSTRRFEVVDAVMEIQENYRAGNEIDDDDEDVEIDELIRQSCERITRPSRLFAAAMAQAHAAAGEQTSTENEVRQ